MYLTDQGKSHGPEQARQQAPGNASILKDGRAVFNIAGNKYRLVVWINSMTSTHRRFNGDHHGYQTHQN
ncbi:type II toxin-antitoxin system HigB family toxin [Herbaspirillum sp. B65]|uniref:type II toxin-antitoxin system HigB family toxin n=1 Tax=Herbaspirillum sp. B65 TaxID=137708 RepID=UPI000A00746C